jgi:hypothetical protein
MGQAISAAVDDIVAGKVPAEKNNMDDLNMLQKMADAKLDAFQYELTEYKSPSERIQRVTN